MEQSKKKPKGSTTQNFFYGPVGQYIEHVEHNHFGMDSEGNFQFDGEKSEKMMKKLFPDLPDSEQMSQAVVATVKQGLWWSNRSWAVVYRVYQMKGYMGGFSHFIRDVENWPVKTGFECNYDAVQKPITSGVLLGNPENWEAQGAPKQASLLAYALLEELENMKSPRE